MPVSEGMVELTPEQIYDATHACPQCNFDTQIPVFPPPQLDAERNLAAANAKLAEYREALGFFMGEDDKVQVGVGGNPLYVDRCGMTTPGKTEPLDGYHLSQDEQNVLNRALLRAVGLTEELAEAQAEIKRLKVQADLSERLANKQDLRMHASRTELSTAQAEIDRLRNVIITQGGEIGALKARVEIRDNLLSTAEAALEKADKHAKANGMETWPVFKRISKDLAAIEKARDDAH
jgi:hypothetical protein